MFSDSSELARHVFEETAQECAREAYATNVAKTATLALAVDSARADKGVAERRRGKVVKAERKLQSKVRTLEKKLEQTAREHDKTEALLRKADNTPKRSPKKRARVGSPDVRSNLGKYAKEAKAWLTKQYPDPVMRRNILLRLFEDEQIDQHIPTTLKSQLKRVYDRSAAIFLELLPEGSLLSAQEEAASEVVRIIQERWSTTMCLRLKTVQQISRRKWRKLRQDLSMVLDETTGIPSPIQLPFGVVMPTLATDYAMLQEKWAIRKEFNVDLDTTTKAVQLDVYKLQKDVAHAISKKFFEEKDGVINTPDGLPAQAQISMDACYMCKGLNCTNLGYKFPAGSIAPNSPLEWKTCCLLEGTDKWASVWKDAKITIQRFNQLIRGEFEGRKPLTMKWLGGGDMASISSSLGLSGCASPFPCPMCEAPRKDMCADKTIAKGFTQRNLTRIKLLSHTVEGKCPGCRFSIVKEFSKKKEEAKWQMKLAQPGDSQPPVGKLLQGRHLTWQEMHFGVAYGKFPFYDGIEPRDWISCILHLNLRIVGGLATKTIYNQIGKNKEVGEKQEETIANILKSRGIYVRTQSIKAKSKNVTQAKQDFKSHSFSGLDAETLSLVAVELLAVVSPPDVRASMILLPRLTTNTD